MLKRFLMQGIIYFLNYLNRLCIKVVNVQGCNGQVFQVNRDAHYLACPVDISCCHVLCTLLFTYSHHKKSMKNYKPVSGFL